MRQAEILPFVIRKVIAAAGESLAMRKPSTAYDRAACGMLADALQRLAIWATDTRETSRREAYGAARAALALCDAPGANVTGALDAAQEIARAVVACVECEPNRALAAIDVARRRAGLRAIA